MLPSPRQEVEQRRCRLVFAFESVFAPLSHFSLFPFPSPMLGRKTDNKRVMTPEERAIRRQREHISTGRPHPISVEVMKKSASSFFYDFGVCFKGHLYRKFAHCGERPRFRYYSREFKGRREGEETATKSGGRARVGWNHAHMTYAWRGERGLAIIGQQQGRLRGFSTMEQAPDKGRGQKPEKVADVICTRPLCWLGRAWFP